MRQTISEQELRDILGKDLENSRFMDEKIEAAYEQVRQRAKIKDGKERDGGKKGAGSARRRKKGPWRKVFAGIGTVAAAFLVAFTCCAVNPALAEKIPLVGSLFERLQSIAPFGQIPEEQTTTLYNGAEAGEGLQSESEGGEGEETQSAQSEYRKTQKGVTITLTESYVSNQALFVGVCIENEQEFPQMASDADGTYRLRVETEESYSFRQDTLEAWRDVEGTFEDANTFIGIMRIDYSDIDVDSSKYDRAVAEAEAENRELPTVDTENWDQYFERIAVPDSFEMKLNITNVAGYLAEPTKPEGMKSGEELEQMSDEEWADYMDSLPDDWKKFPNVYKHWFQEGSWEYDLTVAQKDDEARVITIHEVNEAGIGMESIEISSVEMTLNPIEPADHPIIAVALDRNGKVIRSGSENVYELAIAGHDISTVYLYACDYYEYMDELKGYLNVENTTDQSVKELLEERALFKMVVDTTK